MHPLDQEAMAITESLRETRPRAAQLAAELGRAGHDLPVGQARVERALIKRGGGGKSMAPAADGRARIFVLAMDADADHRLERHRVDDLSQRLARHRAEVRSLSDRLNVVLAAVRADRGD